jgi:hypothetical protein
MNLFMVYVGGKHKQSLIELHDIRFVAAKSIEEAFGELQNSWWGVPSSLHLDCWGILKNVDGYDVYLRDYPPQTAHKLYFINLGGYNPLEFTELHKNICVVAENVKDAASKAKQQILNWQSPHKDYVYSIDDIIDIQKIIADEMLHIHLDFSNNAPSFEFICSYTPIPADNKNRQV